MTEQWRGVLGYEGVYQVSDLGRVMRIKVGSGAISGRILKPSLLNGYPSVALRKDGKSKRRYIHRLVAEAFLGPCPEGHLVHHKDEDPTNAYLTNLEYMLCWIHQRKHFILNCLKIGPRGPGRGITMFD